MDTNGDIEMQDQGDKGDVNLETGPTVIVQADIGKEEAAPLLEKFTAAEETDVNLEKGPTVAVVCTFTEIKTICHLPFTIQADIEEEESAPLLQSFTWKPKFDLPNLAVLLKEWKDTPNTKGTQTKRDRKKLIKDIFSIKWLKPFFISLVLFLSSTYDVGSDGILAHSFIGGTNYTKIVKNQSDTVVENCTLVGKTFHVSYKSEIETEEITTYEYDCFEEDPYWGGFTLCFMFVPGFSLWIFISLSLGHSGLCTSNWVLISSIISMMALIPAFPVLLLLVKFLSIFHKGDEWKKLDDLMSLCEGQLESYLQVGLQSYIICVRADRQRDQMRGVQCTALQWFDSNF